MSGKSGKLLAVVFVISTILAVSATSHAYVTLKGGLFMPNSDGEGKGLKDWKNGFGGELAFGGEFGIVAIEGGIGGFNIKPEDSDDLNMWVIPVTLTAKAVLRPSERLGIYLGGGLGYHVGYLGGDATDDMDSDDKIGKGLGFHAVGGLDIPLGPVALVAEVKWSKADVKFGDSDEKINIGGITTLVGLRF